MPNTLHQNLSNIPNKTKERGTRLIHKHTHTKQNKTRKFWEVFKKYLEWYIMLMD